MLVRYFPALVATLAATLVLAAPCWSSELAGRVTDSQGQPLAGATMMVLTAHPKVGIAVFCPSCYLDCTKTAKTAADGKFALPINDPSLSFRVAVVADGFRAQIVEPIVADAPPTSVQLEPLPASLPPTRRLRGRVIDAATQKPVAGATVEPIGIKTADEYVMGGVATMFGIDALAVTNLDGDFVITGRDPALSYDVMVKSPRHAPKRFSQLPVGDDVAKNTLPIQTGVAVTGRLLVDGKPAAGVPVGLAGADRRAGNFAGRFEAGTDANGYFDFEYLPPDTKYSLYTRMDGMTAPRALPLETVQAGKSESTLKLGDRELKAAHAVTGRIVLADGAAITTPIQILLFCDKSGDTVRARLEKDGSFRFPRVPDHEAVTIAARIPGYHLATQGNTLRVIREGTVGLAADATSEDLKIMFEPESKSE